MTEVSSPSGSLVPSHELVLLQSRLYSPGYAGPGRWILFRPSTRQAFSAIGPDVVPDVIRILDRYTRGPRATRAEDGGDHALCADNSQVAQLVTRGLLGTPDSQATVHDSFLWHYHRANFDYPFLDYADPTCFEDEDRMLRAYQRRWPAPPAIDDYEGNSIDLPEPNPDALEPDSTLTLESLATILHITFAPTGSIETKYVKCIRRTSPSGGARHPTEGRLLIRKTWGGLGPGLYDYDHGRHRLVEVERSEPADGAEGIVILLRSRVERAMWRYRDLRALRPLLLDVGHIAETLSILFGRLGVSTTLANPLLNANPSSEDILGCPVLASLAVASTTSQTGQASSAPIEQGVPAIDSSRADRFLTNPAMFMRFESDSLCARVVWPTREMISLDLLDFRVLSHCLPSNRGDRQTTVEGICTAVPGMSPQRLHELCSARALLPEPDALALYDASRLWARYGWYLSELAHLECLTSQRSLHSWQPSVHSTFFQDNLNALQERRTTRAFAAANIVREDLYELLRRALAGLDLGPEGPFRVFVAPLRVTDLQPSLYEWNGGLNPLSTGETIDGPRVRSLTIGQESAGAGAAAIWLTRRINLSSPADYELNLIEMGRIGQRICLVATEMGLGVFLTPAVNDSDIGSALGLDDTLSTVSYFFSIGVRRGTTSS